MSDEREYLTFEQAEAMLPDGDDIHTFRNGSGMLIGADWRREQVIEALRQYKPELSGETATRMNHGIYLEDAHGPLFIATKE